MRPLFSRLHVLRINHVEWTWRWDSEWISSHTSDGYVYGYNKEDYGTDVKFLSTSVMSDAENSVSVQENSSISPYMSITPSDDGLAADLTCEQSFGCPIILTCTVYDEMDNSVSADIRLDYDSVLGSLGTLEDWAEVESEAEFDEALETSCNIRLARDIECSVEIEHRTHLDLNGHTLSGEADVSKRARIENGKMTSSEDGFIAEGEEKIEIKGVDIEAGKTGVIANSNVEISNCSVTGASAYGIYASGGSVAATACEIKSEASDTDTHAAVYSASSASITINGGSVEGGVGAWAYTGNVTLEDVSVTSTAGDGLKAYQGTVKATGVTIDSADSGAYCTDTGTVTLTSCTVTGTTYATYQSGGTLTVSGGTLSGPNGCYCSNGTTNLKDSCSVTATGSEGAAVREAGGSINLDSCTLTGYYGIRCSSGSITATSSCTFGTCTYGAYSDGGTVNLNGAKMTSSVSSGAWANGGTIDIYGSTSISVSSYALQVSSGTMTLEGGSSAASTGSYGASLTGGTLYVQDSATSLSGTRGIYLNSSTAVANIEGGTIEGTQYGVYISAGSLSMSGGKIEVESSSSAVYGVYLTGSSSSAEIKGGNINSKNTDSSGSYVSYGVYVASSSNITVSGGEITGEGNEGNGYGIYITGSSSKATLSGGTITGKNNSSTKVSVGVYIPSGTVTIEDSAEIAATSPLANAYGLYITGGTANIYDGTITGEMTDETSYYAAGVRITSGTLNVYGGNIIGAGGESDGIGIRIEGGTATVEDCSISATGSSSTYGVSNTGASLKLSSCSISSSTSSSSYGVHSSGSSASTTISGGSISGGNGVYASAGEIKLESSCSVSVSTSSSYKCAAVWEAGGTINLTSCSLTGYYGVRCSSGSISVTSSCTVKSCTYGTYSTGGTVNLNGCALTSSITTGAYATGGTINVYGSTSITASSYGAYADGGTINVYGSTSISSTSNGVVATSGTVSVYGSATVTSTGSYGASVGGGTVELTSSSATITGSSYGVYIANSSSEFTMSAGTVKGTRALHQTAGTATITGGTLTATSSYTIYQTGGTMSCTATFSTAQNHQIVEAGGTATFTNCSVNGGSSYYALHLSSGTVTIDGSSSKFYSSSTYAIYVSSGTLNLRGGLVENDSSSASTFAVYNYNGYVYGKGADLYHYWYGYAFYNYNGYFNLASGTYRSYGGPVIYIRSTSSLSFIGQGEGTSKTTKKDNCHIYREYANSSYNDPVVQIAGGTVTIYGCYIESSYGPALKLTGSPTVELGYAYSGSSNSKTDIYTPCIETSVAGEYAIYVNMSSGEKLSIYEADIYGVDDGIYIYDGTVVIQYVWITLSESSNDAYAVYVENRTMSYFKLTIDNEYVYAESMATKKTVYGIYSANSSNTSSINYSKITYTTTGKTSTKTK